ncbi:hypothetical protein PV04_10401 [Phialophora macrospora]|uniref:ER membrane protein complex subunit 6 n=1 Tax=Phialophora macrospora TaxID=1851006 RepID=A0A0D2FQD1_9EURO|nr:hypothetical protein PV04_10401 [Phialophora macrospora]
MPASPQELSLLLDPLVPESIQHNTRTLSNIRSISGLLLGIAAGILGLESLYGFAFYLFSNMLISLLFYFLLAGGTPQRYFAGSAGSRGLNEDGKPGRNQGTGAWREIWFGGGLSTEALSGAVNGEFKTTGVKENSQHNWQRPSKGLMTSPGYLSMEGQKTVYLIGFAWKAGRLPLELESVISHLCPPLREKHRWSGDQGDTFVDDSSRRSNLFHDLVRITLSLNKPPLPRIGSLVFDDQGQITLTNRPLTLRLQSLENEGVATAIGRKTTYTAVEPYVLDLLTCHGQRIYHQPNSIHDQDDDEQQVAALTMMRATLHLHPSNIYVDDDGHVTSLIDLEWACSLSIEFQCPPYWLSGRAVDEIEPGEPLDTFSQMASEYLDSFEQEERQARGPVLYQTSIMRKCWELGSFWYFHAANSPKGLYRLFNEHLQPLFCPDHCSMRLFDQIVAPYWSVGAAAVIQAKMTRRRDTKID